MKCILGKKVGMTQIFLENGEVVPVTRVQAGPCQVVAVRTVKKDGKDVQSIQLGFDAKKEWRLTKPELGHLKGLNPVGFIREFETDEKVDASRGDMITVETFAKGDVLDVVGTSKGHGFAGVVKRYHFGGGPASHGHKDNLRARGSSGAGGVQRVFKGMRMAGRMGGERVTVKNLQLVAVNPETNELLIKGAVPGGRNGYLMIFADGKISFKKNTTTQSKVEDVASEPAAAVS
jgi:large subunit ribosomal protein L3